MGAKEEWESPSEENAVVAVLGTLLDGCIFVASMVAEWCRLTLMCPIAVIRNIMCLYGCRWKGDVIEER